MLDFLSEAIKNFRNTGAVWPSSPVLAKAMTRSLDALDGRRRVLEVGPGTGPFTKAILRKLRAGDHFDLVEINEKFCRNLERGVLAKYRPRHPQVGVELHCAPIEEADLGGDYDLIVCGLPFNNFPPKLMRSIFRRMFAQLKVGGELVYFEYAGVRVMKAPVVDDAGRARLRRIDTIGKSLRRRHAGQRELVLANFPPAYTYRLVNAGPEGAKRARRAPARGGATARR